MHLCKDIYSLYEILQEQVGMSQDLHIRGTDSQILKRQFTDHKSETFDETDQEDNDPVENASVSGEAAVGAQQRVLDAMAAGDEDLY